MTIEQQQRDYLRCAYKYAATASHDPKTKNGAVLVSPVDHRASMACNHFPLGVKVTAERLEDRATKLTYMEHAERAAIYKAARDGIETFGATLYCFWSACPECARAIICAGIKKVVRHKQCHDRTPERWKQPIEIADQMFREAGVEVIDYDGEIGDCESLIDGVAWKP